ncbi:MAG: 4-hydroxy-tetrahydrodipicolinate synthase [Opitutales bacterium]|nr:4-hydroxy-tetrahydrodipicolinate synthase [Opitutales bacterium]
MDPSKLQGAHTALVTPMLDGAIDFDGLTKHVERQIHAGISGVAPAGTTGESPTLPHDDHVEVIRCVVAAAAGRVPVVAGTGSNSTEEAISLTKAADEAGADGFLVVAPYYNKPSQDGLLRHFGAIAEVTEKPIVLYSIPGRCGIEIGVETVARLYEKYPHVNAIKEAGGRCEKVSDLVRLLGPDFVVLSGDDDLTLPFISCGAVGVISVASNVIPEKVAHMTALANGNDFQAAAEIHRTYHPLFQDLFVEPNPVPVKFLMHHLGLLESHEVRLPLSPLLSENQTHLSQLGAELGLE